MFGFEGIERLARNIAVSFNHASGGDLRHKEPHKWPRTAVSLFGPTIAANATKAALGRACSRPRLCSAAKVSKAAAEAAHKKHLGPTSTLLF
jgi:hypothetical protein